MTSPNLDYGAQGGTVRSMIAAAGNYPSALKRIVAHYGPLSADHKLYLGSAYNVLLEFDHPGDGCKGRVATQPLNIVVQTYLGAAIQYSVDHAMLEVDRWTDCLPRHIREQIPRVLRPPPRSLTCDSEHRGLDHCRVITRAVRLAFDECCLEADTDESCRVIRDGVCEIFLDAEDMGTQCYEKIVQSHLVLFRRCLGPQLIRKRRRLSPPAANTAQLNNKMTSSYAERTDTHEAKSVVSETSIKLIARQSIESIKALAIRTVQQDPHIWTRRISGEEKADENLDDPDGVGGGDGRYWFGNFSLLASRAKTAAQFRHVDAFRYELQMVMALQPRSTPTATYIVPDRLESPEDAMMLWREMVTDPHSHSPSSPAHNATVSITAAENGATVDQKRPRRRRCRRSRRRRDQQSDEEFMNVMEEVSDHLLQAMKEDEVIVCWLHHFGKVLCRPHRMIESRIACDGVDSSSNASKEWGPGCVLCVPGGTVHGAPRSSRFRAVLFFTVTPAGKSRYRPSDQFTGPTLAASIAHQLWDRKGIGELERQFLAAVLKGYVLDDPSDPSVDFASYLDEEIGSHHEVGEILRDAQDAKQAGYKPSPRSQTALGCG